MGNYNTTYEGYTSCRLEQRIHQHRYQSSSIHQYQQNDYPNSYIPDLPTSQSTFNIYPNIQLCQESKLFQVVDILEYHYFFNEK